MAKSVEQGSVDVLGLLPGPALKSNNEACDILHGEVFAYAVSGSVAVVDVRTPFKLVKGTGMIAKRLFECCMHCQLAAAH